MDEMEMGDLDRPEDRQEKQQEDEEEETSFGEEDRRDESMVIIDTSNPNANVRGNLDAMKEADRYLGRGIGVKNLEYTLEKKKFLKEMGINVEKKDGPSSSTVLEKLSLTRNKKGQLVGEFDGKKVFVRKGKGLAFSEDKKLVSKVNEFKELVKEAEAEHEKTPVALIEEKLDVHVTSELTESVLRSSLERLEEEITERTGVIATELTENELREFRGILGVKIPTVEQRREGWITTKSRINGLKTEETHWREEAERQSDPKKKLLYEAIADVAALKADEMHLRTNQRPESELAQSIVEEEAVNNDLTRFERFKEWAKRNLGGISIVAISVAGIVTTIVKGARNAVKRGARATSKFAKALKKLAEKAAPVLGALLNLAAKVLTLGAKAVGFLSENLWLLAVSIAHLLFWEKRRVNIRR